MNIGTKVARLGFALRYASMVVLLIALILKKEPTFPDESVAEIAHPLGDEIPAACATASVVSNGPSSLRLCLFASSVKIIEALSSRLRFSASSSSEAGLDIAMLREYWNGWRLTSDSNRSWIMFK